MGGVCIGHGSLQWLPHVVTISNFERAYFSNFLFGKVGWNLSSEMLPRGLPKCFTWLCYSHIVSHFCLNFCYKPFKIIFSTLWGGVDSPGDRQSEVVFHDLF